MLFEFLRIVGGGDTRLESRGWIRYVESHHLNHMLLPSNHPKHFAFPEEILVDLALRP
jgi:hypothetical protein